MKTKWTLSGIDLVCPSCKGSLSDSEASLDCEGCGQRYEKAEGIPVMLSKSDPSAARKEEIQTIFTSINQVLENKGLSRFSTFVNWGYAPLDEEEGSSRPGAINQSSIRLLQEIIGDHDLANLDVLEIGCGRGGNINALCRSFGPRSVVGLDLTPSNIVFCERNNRFDHAHFCVGDAEELPIGSGSCDVVLNIESSHLYPNIGRFYEEVYRVLKPGGLFLYADVLNAPEFEVNEAELHRLGFRMTLSRDITPNVLRSGDASLRSRIHALDGTFGNDDGTLEWLEAPGTQNHKDMMDGRRLFKILHFVKG
ncbi:methyltransferase domain-containing protein [Cohnella sp. CFH 77786]|uniref:methyltransferase domain-containing protein n=1 Tax=Cohnella sp. CFH 77786 TaxID=2662265 RepID=UPI001C60B1CC|nr:methyltransferase domain-containing protein [Cohnella sp. CFH 77786]